MCSGAVSKQNSLFLGAIGFPKAQNQDVQYQLVLKLSRSHPLSGALGLPKTEEKCQRISLIIWGYVCWHTFSVTVAVGDLAWACVFCIYFMSLYVSIVISTCQRQRKGTCYEVSKPSASTSENSRRVVGRDSKTVNYWLTKCPFDASK